MRDVIYLAGFPRSGTTWFANLFNIHPEIIYRHEVLGRGYKAIPEKIFVNLKNNHGLSKMERELLLNALSRAGIEVDRPPFYDKKGGLIWGKRFHKVSWLVAKAFPLLRGFYSKLYTPQNNLSLFIKETRTSIDIESILMGLRPKCVIMLFRTPEAAINSHLNGIVNKKMKKSTAKDRLVWLKNNLKSRYMKDLNWNEEQIVRVSEAEYLAIKWTVYYEYMLDVYDSCEINFRIVSYEKAIKYSNREINRFYSSLGLSELNVNEAVASSNKKYLYKDSSSSYYSIYRDANFDPEHWRKELSNENRQVIKKHTFDMYRILDEMHG